MASSTAETKETLAIKPHQEFKGHTKSLRGAIHLPGGQRIITCSDDGSLRVWNLKSGKQIGEDWRDGEGGVYCIALSPDEKKVVSGSEDGGVRLWDIDTSKVIAKWMGHTQSVASVCWSRGGQRVLSGSNDGTARQWDVESGETILEPIETGHTYVWRVVYSPDMSMIATGGYDGPPGGHGEPIECSIKMWDTKTGELVATLKGHTGTVTCLAISPNDRILASASYALDNNTVLLWDLDNGQLIGPPLRHADYINSVSFSEDGKLLATSCEDTNAYTWDVAAIVREAGLDDLLSDPKLALHNSATQPPVQRRPPAYQIPQGFFDGVPPNRSHSSARRRVASSVSPGGTLLGRLFHRNRSPSSARATPLSSPLHWARNFLKQRRQRGEGIESQKPSPAVVEVPYAKGKRRNACAREKRKKLFPPKIPTTASSSRPPKPNVTQSSSQPQTAISGSSSTPTVGDATGIATTSRPDATIRQAGLWTRFWLFLCCLSPEYTDGHH